jgi:hypothetical protein
MVHWKTAATAKMGSLENCGYCKNETGVASCWRELGHFQVAYQSGYTLMKMFRNYFM